MRDIRGGGIGALLAVGVLVSATPNALAFEALREAVVRLPFDPADASGFLFDFLSPEAVRLWRPGDNPGIGQPELNAAIVEPGPAEGLTGIDFSGLAAILTFGPPPNDVVYLAGADVSAEHIGKALLPRGFGKTTDAGAEIFARGEDGHMDPGARDLTDPFGKNLGMAQRIAVGRRGVLAASASATLRAALTMIADGERSAASVVAGEIFERMVRAAADARGSEATAYSASGFTLAAFVGTRLRMEPPDSARPAEPPAAEAPLPPFLFAFLVASAAKHEEASQIALAYPDRAAAESGVLEVTRRLRGYEGWSRPSSARIEATVVDGRGPETIVVVSVIFPDVKDHPSAGELAAWRRDTYSRGFPVLSVSP